MNFEKGEKVVFVEAGYPLTGKRGIVQDVSLRETAITVRFENGNVSTWRASYFLPAPETPSSIPPACGAV